ncbi:MAG: hypothetical protein JWQ13_1196 [Ramlibacter sp.]|jgi:uncharacterized membrane protein|nr:hypothetical protein [Ramlibacter sp.]
MSSFFRRLLHQGLHRPRLLATFLLGAVAWALLPEAWTVSTRALVAWNASVWPYLASMAWLMLRSPPARVRAIAEQEDASSAAVVAIVSAAAMLSLVAIVADLAVAKGGGREGMLAVVLPLATVTSSWFLLGVIYTFHYAHLFYEAPQDRRPLRFPEQLELPSYRDFLYFSFTISAAVQTSDVTVQSTPMRGTVLAQSVLSFFFNAAILGLAVNIAAGVVGGR